MNPSADAGTERTLGRVGRALSLGGLGFLTWGVISQLPPAGARRDAAITLLAVSVAAWLVWVGGQLARGEENRLPAWLASRPAVMVALSVMAAAGGALAAFDPTGLAFPGVAAMAAATAWPLGAAAWLAVAGPAAMLAALVGAGDHPAAAINAVAVAVAGSVVGTSRRETRVRAAQAALLQVNEARAEAERARAELLAGRNHLARELHDVLAHTLSALSLQLEALDGLVAAGPSRADDVRAQLERTRRLVREGVEEARGAVRALRDDLGPLEEQIAALAATSGGGLEVTGTPRRLGPDVTLALYRVAQEAMTNAAKHAGTSASVRLDFGEERVSLTVTNPTGERDLAGAHTGGRGATGGGGYGLQGIRERILLVGGRVETGPTAGGWKVAAEVPA